MNKYQFNLIMYFLVVFVLVVFSISGICDERNVFLVWDKIFGKENFDCITSLIQIPDGSYVMAGRVYSLGAGCDDFCLLKLDSDGNLLWGKTFGENKDDTATSLIQTTDRGYAIAGYTSSYGDEGQDVYVLKTDNQGSIVE